MKTKKNKKILYMIHSGTRVHVSASIQKQKNAKKYFKQTKNKQTNNR